MSTAERPLRAVLLAAGKGTRMKSAQPKVLHDVLGKPILGRVADAVLGAGVEHIHVIVGHEASQVDSYIVSSDIASKVSTHLQEPQLGTGHALMQAVSALEGFSGDLIVSVADVPLLTASTLNELVRVHRSTGAMVTVLSTVLDDPAAYGRIIRDESGMVSAIVEFKDADSEQKAIKEINTGIFVFEWPAVQAGLASLKSDNAQKEYYLTDLVSWANSENYGVAAVIARDAKEVAGINSRLELSSAIHDLRHRVVRNLSLECGVTIVDPDSTWISPEVEIGGDSLILPGTHIMGMVRIGEHCTIGPGTILKGNVDIGSDTSISMSVVADSKIGSHCKIGPFAHIREGNLISDQVRVGNFVELKKSEIESKTNVSHLSYVGDTKVGSGANIGAGTITANYDHLTKRKERTIIGNGASTGSNSVLVAPVSIGDEAVVAAGAVITKNVPAGALAVRRAKQENLEGWSSRRKNSNRN